jgi:hypothetical protein
MNCAIFNTISKGKSRPSYLEKIKKVNTTSVLLVFEIYQMPSPLLQQNLVHHASKHHHDRRSQGVQN